MKKQMGKDYGSMEGARPGKKKKRKSDMATSKMTKGAPTMPALKGK